MIDYQINKLISIMKHIIKYFTLLFMLSAALPGLAQDKEFGKVMVPVGDCNPKYGAGQDSVECIKYLSLYRESYKNWSSSRNDQYLVDAFEHWRRAFFGCPCSSKNIYIDGERMLSYYIENEKDAAKKSALVDTLMIMYDRRVEVFGQPCYVSGRKGISLMQYRPESYEMAYEALKMAFECRDDVASARTIYEYFKATIMMVENGKLDTTDIIDVYDATSEVCQVNIDKQNRDSGIFSLTLDEIEKAFLPYATCEVLVPWSEGKLKDNCENVDLLRKIVKILDKKRCTDNTAYRKAAECLYKVAPDSTSAMALGMMKLSIKSYSESIKYLKDAASAFKNPAMLDRIYLLMADAYSKMDMYNEARSAALKALEYNPNNGQAYMLIGDLYSQSAVACKYKEIYPAYWAAADAYNQAKAVDPSVAEAATNRYASMKARFPSSSQIFFHTLKIGDSFTVGCWIDRTTTVRASD